MDTRVEHRARAQEFTYREQAAAFAPTVRLTASEAVWLARQERGDVTDSDLRDLMGSPDSDGLFVDSEVVATNGMSVSVTSPSEQEDRQVRASERPVPCTYTHRDGMADDGTVWGWTDLQGRYAGVSAGHATRKPDHMVSAAAERKRRQRERERARAAKASASAQRERVDEGAALDFDAVMAAMATNAVSGTGLERE